MQSLESSPHLSSLVASSRDLNPRLLNFCRQSQCRIRAGEAELGPALGGFAGFINFSLPQQCPAQQGIGAARIRIAFLFLEFAQRSSNQRLGLFGMVLRSEERRVGKE